MQLVDAPLKTGGIADEPIVPPTQDPANAEHSEQRATRLAQAASIKATHDEVSAIEAFVKLQEQGPTINGKGVRQKEAIKLDTQITHDARQLFIDNALTDTAPEDALVALAEQEAIGAQEQAREDFPIQQYVNSIAAPGLSTQEREDLGTRLYLQDKIWELSEDIGGLEIAKDIALEIVISPKALWDNMQATGTFNPIKGEATYRKMAAWFQGLSNEQKVEMFPAIQEYIVDAMPRSRAVVFLQGLVDPAFEEEAAFDIGTLGAVDAALIGAGIIGAGLKLRKVFNPIRSAARAGDKEKAAEVNLALMQGLDNELGELMGVDRVTANTNALPFLSDGLDDAAEATLSPAVHERIFQFRDKLKESFQGLSDAKTFVREGFLDNQDRTAAVNRITEEYNTYVANTFQGKDKIVNLTRKTETPDGVTFEFEVTNPDGSVVKDTFTGNFILDDVGFWQRAPKSSVFFSELKQSNKTDFMSTVKAAIRLDNTAASVSSQLRNVIKDASKPIKGFKGKPRKARIDEVDHVLRAGDDLEKEFTPQELMAGVDGVKLDNDQIEYYYNMRGVMNGLGILRNMEVRRAMNARGVKEIQVGGAERFFGEVVDDAANAKARVRGLRSVYRFDGSESRKVDIAELDLDEAYAQGFRLARLEEDSIIDGARYQHVLVKGDKVTDLPGLVLDLKKGYIPRINPSATYFVQAFTPSKLDGLDDTVRKAVRSFDSKADAEKFAGEFDLIKESEGFNGDTLIRVVEDGELEAFRAGDSGMTQTGGLIYSPRARTPVPHNDGSAATVPRASALESIELYLENTKNFMTRNEWRMGLRKKWENTARFKLGQRVKFEDGENIADTELRTLHQKISDFSGYMDKSERAWENTVKGTYEWSIDKFGRNRISDFILTQRQKDPMARLRAATFHTLLGFYNPIQLWVQAQGAAVAFSMNITNPVRMGKAFRQQHALALTQHVNFDDAAKLNSKIAKASGFDSVEEMQQMRELWQKSGLYDSTLSNADVEAAARGFPTTGSAVKKFFDSGLLFFRTGELFNRRFAFLTAVDELGGAAKVQASDTLFKEALDRTNNLILNLGKANRAAWQKGFLSIPTQFLQIQTKTIETILGLNGALTKAESAKLLMGQFALYGAAGSFGGQWALRQLTAMAGKDQIDVNNIDEEQLRAMTGGFTDWFLYQLGADVVGSDRGALLNGMDQTIFSLFTEEMTAFEWFAGPSSVGPQRLWQKLKEISPYFGISQDINGQVSFDGQDIQDTLLFISKGMGELALSPFATGRQIDKFMLMQDLGVLRDKNGNLVSAPLNGFNWQTEWATAMGFKPNDLQEKFDLSEINQTVRDYVRFRSNMLLLGWDDFLQDYNRARAEGRTLTEEQILRHRKRQAVLINSISDPGVRQRVRESFRQRLIGRRSGNSQLDRQQQEFYDNMVLDVAGELTSNSTRLIQTREQ